jgi:hypothetical protein
LTTSAFTVFGPAFFTAFLGAAIAIVASVSANANATATDINFLILIHLLLSVLLNE